MVTVNGTPTSHNVEYRWVISRYRQTMFYAKLT